MFSLLKALLITKVAKNTPLTKTLIVEFYRSFLETGFLAPIKLL